MVGAIQTSSSAIKFSQRQLELRNRDIQISTERLASGKQVNRSADNASGLAISNKLLTQVNGLKQGYKNAQDGMSLLQTLEGALQEYHTILQRMRSLAIQSANDVLTSTDRGMIQVEVDELKTEIDKMVDSVEFNQRKLLKGTFENPTLGPWKQLTNLAGIMANGGFDISPDGTKIAFTSNDTLKVMNTDGSNMQTIASFTATVWSVKYTPDGQALTFDLNQPSGRSDAMIINIDGTNIRDLSNTPAIDEYYTQVTPDGKNIIWQDRTNGDLEVKSTFPNINPVYTGNRIGNWFNYFPDGNKIIYHHDIPGPDYEILISDINGNILQQITNNSVSDLVYGSGITPDLSKVVFTRHSDVDPYDNTGELYIMNIDGSNPVRLSNNNSWEHANQLSQDGKTMYFQSNQTGFDELYAAELNWTGLYIHDGANKDQNIEIDLDNMSTYALGISALNVETRDNAEDSISMIDSAINKVSEYRAGVGATMNRVEQILNKNSIGIENQAAAESRITDLDISEEMVTLTKNKVLEQTTIAAMAQTQGYSQDAYGRVLDTFR